MDRRQDREFKCAIKVGHFAVLSLRIVFAKVNNTMLLHNDSLALPTSLSFCQFCQRVILFTFKPSKNIWNMHERNKKF